MLIANSYAKIPWNDKRWKERNKNHFLMRHEPVSQFLFFLFIDLFDQITIWVRAFEFAEIFICMRLWNMHIHKNSWTLDFILNVSEIFHFRWWFYVAQCARASSSLSNTHTFRYCYQSHLFKSCAIWFWKLLNASHFSILSSKTINVSVHIWLSWIADNRPHWIINYITLNFIFGFIFNSTIINVYGNKENTHIETHIMNGKWSALSSLSCFISFTIASHSFTF